MKTPMGHTTRKLVAAIRDAVLISIFAGVVGFAASLISRLTFLPVFALILLMGVAATPIAFAVSGFLQRKQRWRHLARVGGVYWAINLAVSLSTVPGLNVINYPALVGLSLVATATYVAVGGGLSYVLDALAKEFTKQQSDN